ncbi:MAG: ABC transporter permease [Ardenticatenales bacterium]
MTTHTNVAAHERRLTERLGELWAYRHLVGNLVIRDLKVRYKNSTLGFLWSLASPLLMMLVFYLIFGVMQRASVNRAFHLFVLTGLLPWNWFNMAVAGGINCIVGNASLINKVYFPREILPISVVLGELVNFLFAVPVLIVMLYLWHIPLTIHALWLPVIIAIQAVFTLGVVFLLACANVYYRDTAKIMEVVLLAWFFATPIFYDYDSAFTQVLHVGPWSIEAGRLAYILNPMGTLVANYRTVLYGSPLGPPSAPDALFLLRTAATAFVILVIGYWAFTRRAGRFGEEV